MQIDWPPILLKLPSGEEEWSDEGECLFRGLRVRMGLHSGIPHCEQDQITLRTEYFGPVLDTAARVVSHAIGGQIVISADVYKSIANQSSKLDPCVVDQAGTIALKGGDSTSLYYVCFFRNPFFI